MKVLVGVDGSTGCFEAVRQVGQLLAPGTDEIGFYFTPTDLRLHESSDTDPEMSKRARQALAQAVFDEAKVHLPEPLRNVRTILGTQKARQGLIAAAAEFHADLIAVGARGMGPLKSLLLGSVSSGVVDAAPIPVYVARSPKHSSPAPRVVVGYDQSNSARMVEVLQHFHWPPHSQGRVITVIESMFPGAVPPWLEQRARDADSEAIAQAFVQEHEQEKKARREALNQYVTRLPTPFQTEPIVAEGHPGEKILEAVERDHATLVVVGKSEQGAFQRWLLGSTSQQVLHEAPCSVLVVPRRDRS